MLKSIRLVRYKAFDNVSVALSPLTLFFGPNNSGKSSILSSVRVLAQTIQSYDSNVFLLLNGTLGDFGTYTDLVHGNDRRRHFHIGLEWTLRDRQFLNAVLAPTVTKASTISVDLAFKFRAELRELVLHEFTLYSDGNELVNYKFSEADERLAPCRVLDRSLDQPTRTALSKECRFFHFLPYDIRLDKTAGAATDQQMILSEKDRAVLSSVSSLCNPLYELFTSLEYVGAMRVPPTRLHPLSGEKHRRAGATGLNAANILVLDSLRKGSKSRSIQKRVTEWLSKAEIAAEVKVNLSDRFYELTVKHPITGEFENYADVGLGNSQVLPVLVGGYNLRTGNIFLVEEPEIHLHPRAQAALGDFLLDLKRDGIQVLAETHSEHLMVRLQQHVAKGFLKPTDVAIYYVSATPDGKRVTRIEMDELGRFTSKWPEGFFPERLSEAEKLATLRMEQLEADTPRVSDA